MYKLWKKDGLSRQQRIENIRVPGEIKLMDDQLHSLGQRAAHYSRYIHYYNLQNQKDGTFDQVIGNSIFLVTSNIRGLNIAKEEQFFLALLENNYYPPHQKEEFLINKLLSMLRQFESWVKVTSYFEIHDCILTLRSDLINQVVVNLKKTASVLYNYAEKRFDNLNFPVLSNIWGIIKYPVEIEQPEKFYKSSFYKFQNSIQFLQRNVDLYETEILNSGYNDPAIGLLIAFLGNHNKIIGAFNERWKTYGQFFLEKILKAVPLKAIPDSTYLKISKSGDKDWLEIPQGTIFQTEDNIRFSGLEPLWVNNVSLKSIVGLFEDKDDEIEPAGGLDYVTALKKVDLSQLIDAPVDSEIIQAIFEQKGKKSIGNTTSCVNYTSVGIMIRSWSLLLREGSRTVSMRLIPTDGTVKKFKHLIEQIMEKWGIPEKEVIYKLLNDIFYLEVITPTGWQNINSYNVQFDTNADSPVFEIIFSVSASFPAICHYEAETGLPPALRLLLNRNAWLFPYSWLKEFEFHAIKIRTKVEGLTNLQLYSELGKIDITMPFYPFGLLPGKGSWLVFGSYEMAVKKVTSFDINLKWGNMPDDDYGFAGYFNQYRKDIDNCSFTVGSEVLKNRKWIPAKVKHTCYLFNTISENGVVATAPKARLQSESWLNEIRFDDLIGQSIKEDEYRYNMFASNGFFRLRLTNPEMGFGHLLYQKILSDVLMQNSRVKKIMQTPNPPFSPQAEQIIINYTSEDEISLGRKSNYCSDEIYHIHPFGNALLNISGKREAFKIIPDLNSRGSLLFGFDRVNGGETIRLFINLSPQQKEIDKQKFPEITWYYGDGYNWSVLPQNEVIKDDTRKFLESGVIEIRLNQQLPDLQPGMGNLFWLKASIEKNVENISDVKGFYLHVLKVERVIVPDTMDARANITVLPVKITKTEQKIPGLANIMQLSQTSGGKIAEDDTMMRVRLSERISHRNRAINVVDFEKIVLENFSTIRKVKCFPCTDSKSNRQGVVTLAIIPIAPDGVRAPMSNCKLLIDIEEFLQGYTNMFTKIDAINPVYEYLQVRCKVTLRKTRSEGYYLRLLNNEINNYIAYWEEKNEAPVFGHTISVIDMANFIRSREYITQIKNFSLLYLREKEEFLYELIEKGEFQESETKEHDLRSTIKIILNNREIKYEELKPITPTYPWAILIPMNKHLLSAEWEDRNEKAGINELEIGNTFVIS